MYVYPDMELKILHGIPLTNDYEHTIYFANATSQYNFFHSASFVKYTLTNNMYQRRERGWIQVNINQNELWDCTYLAYKNSHYYNRWFYAFILNVEYINDSVSRINYEIDVMQTWLNMYTLEKCFVEREHTTSDNLFENTVPENLYKGDPYFKSNGNQQFYDLSCSRLMIVATTDDVGENPFPDNYTGADSTCVYFCGLLIWSFDLLNSDSLNNLKNKIQAYITNGYEENILMIVQYPRAFGGSNDLGYYHNTFTKSLNFSTVDGYTPKNKKLFCYPYNYLKVSDAEGEGKEFLFEKWDSSFIGQFDISGTALNKPTINFSPIRYAGKFLPNYEEGLNIECGIICTWVGDSYQVWLAQNANRESARAIGSFLNSALMASAGIITENPMMVAQGVVNSAATTASIIGDYMSAQKLPDNAYGTNAGSVLSNLNGSKGLFFTQVCVSREYAEIIDQYFSKYGYACHKIKVPNVHARQNWTYTKTVGCEIVGAIPGDDITKIKQIFDKGITFWSDGYNVGNYGNFNNPVLS